MNGIPNNRRKENHVITALDVADLAWRGFSLLSTVDCLRDVCVRDMRRKDPLKYARNDPRPLMLAFREIRGRSGSASACAEYAKVLLDSADAIMNLAAENADMAIGVEDAYSLRLITASEVGYFKWYADRRKELKEVIGQQLSGATDFFYAKKSMAISDKIMEELEGE